MQRYEVVCHARATIREVWHVGAESAEEARNIVMGNAQGAASGNLTFICQDIEGDEDEREVRTVLELPQSSLHGAVG